MKQIRIKNWKRFQHFKFRRPIWIKLYRDLMDDIEWHSLDPVSAKVLIMLWLIASETEGILPDVKTLSFRLRMKESAIETAMYTLGHWLDISTISDVYQEVITETETETETEKSKDNTVTRPKGNGRFTPPLFEEVSEYCKQRNSIVDPIAFHSHYSTNGWRVGRAGLPMKDWKAAIVTWERRK